MHRGTEPGNLLWTSNLRVSRRDQRTTDPSTFSLATNTSIQVLLVPQTASSSQSLSSPQATTSSSSPLPVSNEDFDTIMDDDYKTYAMAGSGSVGTVGSHEEEDHTVGGDSTEPGQHNPPQQADSKKEKRKRKPPLVPWKKPKDMPKRPLSAYNLFFKERREAMMLISSSPSSPLSQARSDESIDSSQGPKPSRKKKSGKSVGIGFANLARTIASEWKELDQELKAPYEAIASSEKNRYDKEMLLWRAKQKEEKDNIAAGVTSSLPTPSIVMGDTAGTSISGSASMEDHHSHANDLMHERATSMATASPASSDRMVDVDPVTYSVAEVMQHPAFSSHLRHVAGSDASPSFQNMLMMDRALHQPAHRQHLQGEQNLEYSMMMQEPLQEQQQQRQASPFAVPSVLAAMQMSERSSDAFRTLSQQQDRFENPLLVQQHPQQQVSDQGHGAPDGGRFTNQNNLFNPSFRRTDMEALTRSRRWAAAPMVGTIDEQLQHQVTSLPPNVAGGFEGGGYTAAESQFWHSSPEFHYHHDSSLVEGREDLGRRQMEGMINTARRNTWSGMSQAQLQALQQQMALQDQLYQEQQQYPQRRTPIGGMPFAAVASGSASRGYLNQPLDFLMQQQQQQMSQLMTNEQGSLASTTIPDSWMELSTDTARPSNQASRLIEAQENRTAQQRHVQDSILARQMAASELMIRNQSSGHGGPVYPDTWFEADTSVADSRHTAGTPKYSDPIRYSPDGELNEKVPSRHSTTSASHELLTSTSSHFEHKAEKKASQGGFGKGEKGLGSVASSSTSHDLWKPVGIKGSPSSAHNTQSQLEPQLQGAEGTAASSAVAFNQEDQGLTPSSLQVLGMRLDEESVDFLTRLRFNGSTGTSDHSSSTQTED